MAKIPPFHSKNPDDPRVYHDQDDCPEGQQVAPGDRKPGTGGHRPCRRCFAAKE